MEFGLTSPASEASRKEIRSPGRRVRFDGRNLGREGEVDEVVLLGGEGSREVKEEVSERVVRSESSEEVEEVDSTVEVGETGEMAAGELERALMVPFLSGGTARGSASGRSSSFSFCWVPNALAPPSRLNTTLLPTLGSAFASSLALLAASSLAFLAAALAPSGPVSDLLLFL
jgi:hypothetical protein